MKNDTTIYTENSIRTFTGKVFDLKILDPDSICIYDIAHALSQTNRFAGHLKQPYSVAQHSCHVYWKVHNPAHHLAALLHDASEAYLGDMPSPFKKMMPEYKELENKLMNVIAQKFGFEYPLHYTIKEADKEMLDIEWTALVLEEFKMDVWSPEEAEKRFIKEFHLLNK